MSNFGISEGEVCYRNGCQGILKEHEVENCYCHISPPCGSCTTNRSYCPVCGWEAQDEDLHLNDHVIKYTDNNPKKWEKWELRPLDPRKLDYHSFSHTNSSMIKKGVYPEGMTSYEVEMKVRGTFGGRFKYFGKGKFEYIAYTD